MSILFESGGEWKPPIFFIPFSERNKSKNYDEFVAFYEKDNDFSDVVKCPKNFVEDLKRFPGIISPDNSLYVDSPFVVQLANIYRNRAIGHFFQENGIYVIPNVRWGDERSYTKNVLSEKAAFLGVPKNSIVSIGSYGCSQTKEEK